jgi:uncharacterized protein (TIGR02246 family)
MNAEEKAIAAALARYQDTLNQSDTDAVMKLYADDGVFMPQNSRSSVGAEAIRKAYDAVFDAITLSVKFEIAEIRQVAPDWAFARTNSAGRVKVHATAESAAEGNQELFVFQKIGAEWKLAVTAFQLQIPLRSNKSALPLFYEACDGQGERQKRCERILGDDYPRGGWLPGQSSFPNESIGRP